MNGTDEMTISLKDLLYRILLRWRLILVCLLLGAVLFGVVGYKKNADAAAQKSETQKTLTLEEQIEKYETELSDNEVAVVQAAVASYHTYQMNGELLDEYLSNSLRMKFDPNHLPTLRLQYLVDNHYEAVYPVVEAKDNTNDILVSYNSKILNSSVYEEIAEVLNLDCDVSYMRELITVEGYSDIMTVVICGLSEEDCRSISPVIQKAVRDSTGDLKKIYGEFDISLVQETYYENISPDLFSEQKQKREEYNTLISNRNRLADNMTDEQKAYYHALLAVEETENEENEGLSPESGQLSVNVRVGLFNKKYILLGAVAGVFLVCCYFACRYLLSAKLRVKEDLEECFGIANLGVLPVERKKRKILDAVDRWICSGFGEKNGQFSEEERIRMICAGIRIGAKKEEMKSVYVTGVCNDEACEQVKVLLCDKMGQDVETIQAGKSVVYDPESLEAMAAADGVVLVERIDGSRYDELRKEVEICRQNQVKVIGSVILS